LSSDLWYINNWSLWLDIKILMKTFAAVIGQKEAIDLSSERRWVRVLCASDRLDPLAAGMPQVHESCSPLR
jgi:hypothetical protein